MSAGLERPTRERPRSGRAEHVRNRSLPGRAPYKAAHPFHRRPPRDPAHLPLELRPPSPSPRPGRTSSTSSHPAPLRAPYVIPCYACHALGGANRDSGSSSRPWLRPETLLPPRLWLRPFRLSKPRVTPPLPPSTLSSDSGLRLGRVPRLRRCRLCGGSLSVLSHGASWVPGARSGPCPAWWCQARRLGGPGRPAGARAPPCNPHPKGRGRISFSVFRSSAHTPQAVCCFWQLPPWRQRALQSVVFVPHPDAEPPAAHNT